MDLRHRSDPGAPPGVPARCVELAARGLQALRIVDLALADDGGALRRTRSEQRRAALAPLERAARRALVAACSPEVWPPTSPSAFAQTPSSLPPGSVKWNRRPPGNS